MKHHLFPLLILILFYLSSGPSGIASERPDRLTHLVSWDRIVTDAAAKDVPIVILVEQRYCGFCQKLKKEVFRPIANNPNYFDRVIFATVLTDFDGPLIEKSGLDVTGFEFAESFNASTTPTVLFFNSSAVLEQRVVGYFDELNYQRKFINTIESMISKNADKNYLTNSHPAFP